MSAPDPLAGRPRRKLKLPVQAPAVVSRNAARRRRECSKRSRGSWSPTSGCPTSRRQFGPAAGARRTGEAAWTAELARMNASGVRRRRRWPSVVALAARRRPDVVHVSHARRRRPTRRPCQESALPAVDGARSLGGMPVESVFPRLEPLLPLIHKPIQYVGGELNCQVKDWDSAEVRWCADVPGRLRGRPAQPGRHDPVRGPQRAARRARRAHLQRLARPRHEDARARRPGLHRRRAPPGQGLRRARHLLLHRARLHQHARGPRPRRHPAARGRPRRDDPLVIAGGHAAFNPEPIADFIDAAVLGDGEQAVLEITEVLRQAKKDGVDRTTTLQRLAKAGGVYVPALLRRRLPAGRPHPAGRAQPTRTSRSACTSAPSMDLDAWPYPKQPLVPLAETVHERMSVEIFRGCTRGCRFCQAGMITRPVRERSITGIGEMVEAGLEATGYEEVGLLSLSSADHSEIGDIAKGLADRYEGTQTSPVPPEHPRRRVQHRPRAGAVPERAAQRPDLRPRGRQRAAAQGHQQDGQQGRPRQHRHGRVRRRLASGEALLHVRPPHRDRRGRARDRRDGPRGHPRRPRGHRHPRRAAAPSASAASCPSRTRRSSGPASSTPRRSTAGCGCSGTPSATTRAPRRRSASATTTASPATSKACSAAVTAGSARSSRRSGARAASSTAGASTSPTTAG